MKTIKTLRKIGAVAALAVVCVSGTQAAVITLQGTGQVEDVYLRGDNSQTSATANFGASTLLLVGRLPDSGTQILSNSLMRFDMSSLAGQTVSNATLRLYNTNNASQTANVTVNVYEVASANGDWVEGTGTGGTVNGTSDWRFKIQNTGAWAGGQNGAGVAGTDYVNTLIGSATVVDGTAGYVEFTLSASVIQNWITNPSQNYGIILTSPGAAQGAMAYFSSSEAASNGPQLVITTVPEPATWGLLGAGLTITMVLRRRSSRQQA